MKKYILKKRLLGGFISHTELEVVEEIGNIIYLKESGDKNDYRQRGEYNV